MWSMNHHSERSTDLGHWNFRVIFESEVSFFTILLSSFLKALQWIDATFKVFYKVSKEIINFRINCSSEQHRRFHTCRNK